MISKQFVNETTRKQVKRSKCDLLLLKKQYQKAMIKKQFPHNNSLSIIKFIINYCTKQFDQNWKRKLHSFDHKKYNVDILNITLCHGNVLKFLILLAGISVLNKLSIGYAGLFNLPQRKHKYSSLYDSTVAQKWLKFILRSNKFQKSPLYNMYRSLA